MFIILNGMGQEEDAMKQYAGLNTMMLLNVRIVLRTVYRPVLTMLISRQY